MVEEFSKVPLLSQFPSPPFDSPQLINNAMSALDLTDLNSCVLALERYFPSLYPNLLQSPYMFSSFIAQFNTKPVYIALAEDNQQKKLYLLDVESNTQFRSKLINLPTIRSGPSFVTRDDKFLFWNIIGNLEILDLDTLEVVFKLPNYGELTYFRESEDRMYAFCGHQFGILKFRISDMTYESIPITSDVILKGVLSSHYLCVKQDTLHKVHIHSKETACQLDTPFSDIHLLSVSPNENYLAIKHHKNHNHIITILKTVDFEVLHKFKISNDPLDFAFSSDSKLLLILDNSNTLYYYYTDSGKFLSYNLNLQTYLKTLYFLSNNSLLAIDKDSNIFTWQILSESSEVLPEPNLNCTYFPLPGNNLLCASPFEATVYNDVLMNVESIEIGRVSEVRGMRDIKSCLLLVKDLHIVKVDMINFQYQVIEFGHLPEKLLRVMPDNKSVMYVAGSKLVVYELESKICVFSMDIEQVTDLEVIHNLNLVVIPSYHTNSINIFRIQDNSLQLDEQNVIYLNSTIEQIAVTTDSAYLLLALSNKDLQIRELGAYSLLKTLSFSSSIVSMNCTLNCVLITESSGNISYLNLSSLSIITTVFYHKHILSSYISSDNQYLILNTKLNSLRIKNPLLSTAFQITGPDEHFSIFMGHLHDILLKKKPSSYVKELKNLIINPGSLRVQDLCVYYSLAKPLKSSYKDNIDSLVQINKINLIEWCLKKDNNNILGVMLKYLIQYLPQNYKISRLFEDIIISLNNNGHPLLHLLYENMISVSEQDSLPTSCSARIQLPIVNLSETIHIDPNSFMKPEFYSSKDQMIEFKYSVVPLNYEIGSKESIDFLYSLLKCSNEKVLESQTVHNYIKHLWSKGRWIVLLQTIIYVLYLICLCIHTLHPGGSSSVDISFLLVFNSTLLSIELIQFRFSGMKYWRDIWNLIDLCRLVLGYWYMIAWFYESQEDTMSQTVFLLVLFTSFIRGISYFRIAKKTRYFINLLEEVIIDLYGFMAILIYSMLAYLFLSVQMNRNDTDGETSFEANYSYTLSLLFGDLATTPSDWVEWIIATIFLIINPIILLNLLISILGDTYGRVQNISEIADAKELIELVIEVSDMLYWKRDLRIKKCFVMCVKKNLVFEETDEQQKIYKKIYSKLEDLRTAQGILAEDLEQKTQQMNRNVEESLYQIRHEIKIKDETYSVMLREIRDMMKEVLNKQS